MSRYIIGDIHGCYSKLMNVLDKVDFNPEKDVLYSVGDFADRGKPEEIAQTLIYLNNLHNDYPQSFQPVFGNHDIWLYQWFEDIFEDKLMDRDAFETWEYNGGKNTIRALKLIPEETQKSLYEWFKTLPYRLTLDDYIIQHTTIRNNDLFKGIEPDKLTLKQCLDEEICSKDYDAWFWDRYVVYSSKTFFENEAVPLVGINYNTTSKPLIIGHTPLLNGPFYDKELNLFIIDTGSFISGVFKSDYGTLTNGEICILNLDTLEWTKSNDIEGHFK